MSNVLETVFDVAVELATPEDIQEINAAYRRTNRLMDEALRASEQAERTRTIVLRRVLDRVPQPVVAHEKAMHSWKSS